MSRDPSPPAIFIMGPTAAGKSALAMSLCRHLPMDIVSVDASQVYRGMDIGTAKPSLEEQAEFPHRLINIRDPSEPYSAADFCTDARRELAAITASGRIPMLVGGTMFYFRALEYGLSELPSADPQVRDRLAAEARELGWGTLHARLAARDATLAGRINPNDPQRIQRALEIMEITGQAPSALMAGAARKLPYRIAKLAVCPMDRQLLHARIAARFEGMLARGLVTEVERLLRRRDLSPALPAMRTVGYRQVVQYLSGELNYQEMVEKGIIASRQLARRQLTWLRRDSEVTWLDSGAGDVTAAAVDGVFARLRL